MALILYNPFAINQTKPNYKESNMIVIKKKNGFKDLRFGLVSLFNGISTLFRLFNAKAILLEEKLRYYLNHSWEDKGVHTFPMGICPKVNVLLHDWSTNSRTTIPQSIAWTITRRGHPLKDLRNLIEFFYVEDDRI